MIRVRVGRLGATLIAVLTLAAGASAQPARTATPTPAITVTPAGRLVNGQTVTVRVAGVPPGSTLLAVECSPAALQISEDGCENHRDAVFFANGAGTAATTLVVTSQISTAAGIDSCRSAVCLLGVARFTSPTNDTILGASALSFAPTPCTRAIACEDAPAVPTTAARPNRRVAPVRGATLITPAAPFAAAVLATRAGALAADSAITGPYTPRSGSPLGTLKRALIRHAARPALRGVGVLQLSMAGPGTAWSSATDRAVVASVRVDRGPWQTMVLFAGSQPFTYAGFTGPLAVGVHEVSVRVDPRLSTTGVHVPGVALYRVRLRIVTPGNPMYLLERYAPVLYGRASSASSDAQLLTYGNATSLGHGSTELSYETVWSREDAGTSFVPFLEWGEWGRMSDITGTASLDVSASGAVSHATYHWCGCRPPFPAERNSLQEVTVPFTGRYFDGTHMLLRNASGNDYQSDVGTTAFRFQQPAVAGPSAGRPREAVMDAHPWTYRIMADEVRFWYLDHSSDPRSAQPGAARQYAIVNLNTVSSASTVAVAIRLAGSPNWYRSDQGSGAPLYTGGLGRTVVKLPPDWESRRITGVELSVLPASATASLTVKSFEVLGLTPSFGVTRIPTPAPAVVPGAIDVPG